MEEVDDTAQRPINGIGQFLDTLDESETRLLKSLCPLAGTNAYQALVKILTVTLYPLRKLFCRLTSTVKLLTQLEIKELRMGGIR